MYHQVQTFCFACGTSAVLLNWYMSGCCVRGEDYSANEMFVSGVCIAHDVVLDTQVVVRDGYVCHVGHALLLWALVGYTVQVKQLVACFVHVPDRFSI